MAKRKRRTANTQNSESASAKAPEAASPPRPELVVLQPILSDDQDLSSKQGWWALLTFTVLGFITRFAFLGRKDLWFDEVRSVIDAQWKRMDTQFHLLFYDILAPFLHFSSDLTVAARLYPALVGALSIPLVYLVGRRIIGRLGGVLAATVMLVQPFQLFYSQESRFYAPMIFFQLIAFLAIVEFAARRDWRRFLFLPIIPLAMWANYQHQPTTLPFTFWMVIWFALAICLSGWGFSLLSRTVPPLRRLPFPRILLLVLGVVVVGIAFAAAGPWRTRAINALFKSAWGETPLVDFRWSFFARHLNAFGWDIDRWAGTSLSGIVSLVLLFAGVGWMTRYRPWAAALLLGGIVATFVAIFAYTAKPYDLKYSCAMEPAFVLLVAAGLAFPISAIRARMAEARRIWIPAVALFLVFAGALPGLSSYYRQYKQPLRAQLRWVNENVDQSAYVYIFGHMAYLGSIYDDVLDERHTLVWMPYSGKTDGLLEIEVMEARAATGSPTFLATSWPHDIPKELRRFLDEDTKQVLRLPSVLGKEFDGRLFQIPAADESDLERDGNEIVRWSMEFRPKSRKGPGEDNARSLLFDNASTVRYAFRTQADTTYDVEIDVNVTNTDRQIPHFLGFYPDGTEPIFLMVPPDKKGTQTLHARFTPTIDGKYAELSYLSDIVEAGEKLNAGLLIRRIALTPNPTTEPDTSNIVAMPPIENMALTNGGTPLPGWQALPSGFVDFALNPDDPPNTARIHILKDIEGTPMVVSPPTPLSGQSLVYANVELKSDQAFAVGGNATLLFLDANGQVAGQAYMSRRSYDVRIEWEPATANLTKDRWLRFRALRATPPRAASVCVALPFWKIPGKHYPEAHNELLIRNVRLSIAPLRQ
ncbi:glycosyltransferase family 39 protein [bacterium]|nr:glycosyltransferase family 39 protein [bacterium]